MRTGKPSGDPAVDASAIEVLEPLAARPRLARNYLLTLAVVAAVLPVTASLRAGAPWWLLLEFSTAIGGLLLRQNLRSSPSERLASLKAGQPDVDTAFS